MAGNGSSFLTGISPTGIRYFYLPDKNLKMKKLPFFHLQDKKTVGILRTIYTKSLKDLFGMLLYRQISYKSDIWGRSMERILEEIILQDKWPMSPFPPENIFPFIHKRHCTDSG
jgi:hypothetical protein